LRLVVIVALAICTLGALAYTFPALTGRIVDQANVIPPAARASIEAKLKDLEDKSGIQFVVATVNSLEGDEVEPYANALFRAWKLGEKTKNNGVLLLVAPKEHRVRIEVGYGLEGTLTDALSKVIISNAIAPRLKAGDFGGGIERGVDDTITVLTTDASDWQKKPELRVDRQDTTIDDVMPFIVLAIFIFIVFSILRSPQRGNMLSFLLGALLGSGGRGGGDYGDGFSDWGGSSDGGGFSGGGGSSGGGGASGSW
jgi:uncharacterized protein